MEFLNATCELFLDQVKTSFRKLKIDSIGFLIGSVEM